MAMTKTEAVVAIMAESYSRRRASKAGYQRIKRALKVLGIVAYNDVEPIALELGMVKFLNDDHGVSHDEYREYRGSVW